MNTAQQTRMAIFLVEDEVSDLHENEAEEGQTIALDEHLDFLYALVPGDFVARRNELVHRLKAQGRGAEAAAVSRLAKPSASAGLTNRLCLLHEAEFEAFLTASREFRDAQRAADKAAVKTAAENHRRRLDDLLGLAAREFATSGSGGSERTLIPKVRTNLTALSVAGLAAGGGRLVGRLAQDLEPPSFDQLMALGPVKRLPEPVARRPQKPVRSCNEAGANKVLGLRAAQVGPSERGQTSTNKASASQSKPEGTAGRAPSWRVEPSAAAPAITAAEVRARRRAERELASAQQRREAAERAVVVVEARMAEAKEQLRRAREEEGNKGKTLAKLDHTRRGNMSTS